MIRINLITTFNRIYKVANLQKYEKARVHSGVIYVGTEFYAQSFLHLNAFKINVRRPS